MAEKYSKLLVTKLSPSTHDRLKELAKQDRRTLSALSRIIIEDYIDCSKNVSEEIGKTDKMIMHKEFCKKGKSETSITGHAVSYGG